MYMGFNRKIWNNGSLHVWLAHLWYHFKQGLIVIVVENGYQGTALIWVTAYFVGAVNACTNVYSWNGGTIPITQIGRCSCNHYSARQQAEEVKSDENWPNSQGTASTSNHSIRPYKHNENNNATSLGKIVPGIGWIIIMHPETIKATMASVTLYMYPKNWSIAQLATATTVTPVIWNTQQKKFGQTSKRHIFLRREQH